MYNCYSLSDFSKQNYEPSTQLWECALHRLYGHVTGSLPTDRCVTHTAAASVNPIAAIHTCSLL